MSVTLQRKSIREFSNEIIKDDDLKQLLKAAMQAPSAKNQQPWEFVIINNRKLLNELSEMSKGAWMLRDVNVAILVLMKDTDKSPLMRPQDCAAATENILLEAVELGFGAVWIGVYPLEDRLSYVHKLLNITGKSAFSLIALGYPKTKSKVEIRYDESRVHYNKLK